MVPRMTAKIAMSDRHPSVRKLIGLAGGITPLAEKVGVTQSTVSAWVRVPTKHVLRIEELFPGEITRHEMRPDLFGAAE